MELTVDNLSRTLEKVAVQHYGHVDPVKLNAFVNKVVGAFTAGTLDRTTIGSEAWNILGELHKGVSIQVDVSNVFPVIPEREYGPFIV